MRLRGWVLWRGSEVLRVSSPCALRIGGRVMPGSVTSILGSKALHRGDVGTVELEVAVPEAPAPSAELCLLMAASGSGALGSAWLVNPPDAMPAGRGGLTVWFTGLSCSGKTTLAIAVAHGLLSRGITTRILDGDELRAGLCDDLRYNRNDRDENVRRIGLLAELLTRSGHVVLVSAISPYRTARDAVRSTIGEFVEVYVSTPLAVCEQRDRKGMYRRARSGELRGFTGIDEPYEAPVAPDVECNTALEDISASAERIISRVIDRPIAPFEGRPT